MIFAVTYGLGCVAFLALSVLMVVNRRPQGAGLYMLALAVATAFWAFLAALQPWGASGFAHAFESIRTLAWLQLLASILLMRMGPAQGVRGWINRLGVPVLGAAAFLNDLRFVAGTDGPVDFSFSQMLQRVALSVVGILLTENLVRNTHPKRRWNTFPLAAAAGALFAYDLYVFVEALFVRGVDPALLAGRGIVLVLIVPFLVLTMVRNPDLRIDIHVSRNAVFHTVTLTAGGLFLFLSGVIAIAVGRVPGSWGPSLKIAIFCASAVVLLSAVSSRGLRSHLKRFLSENFFSTRYDYRVEWGRFVESLSVSDDLDSLQVRAIRAMAQVVDSPAGALWLETSEGVFDVVGGVNMHPGDSRVRREANFFAGFQGGGIQQFAIKTPGADLPDWIIANNIWLAVPLMKAEQVAGFIALALPRSPIPLNWESFDLLRLIGKQVASYLAEERATRVLAEADALIGYNQKFAFVIHDVKNLASQLAMLVSNMRRFGEHPEFRADMMTTLENSVSRLNGLMQRLRSDAEEPSAVESADPVSVVRSVMADLVLGEITVSLDVPTAISPVRIAPEALRSVLTHLITNAAEASQPGDPVRVHVTEYQDDAVLEITDRGKGMDEAFIRDELFVPLRSKKSRGHGIGAFQAREIVRAAGGDLDVSSVPGSGTTMRILLRKAEPGGQGIISRTAKA